MDHKRFDRIARSLAAPRSRRGFLGGLAALTDGFLAGRNADAQPITQAYCGNERCRSNPGKCRSGCVCCVYSNGNSRCVPPGQCSAGGTVVGAPTTTAPTTAPPPAVCPAGADVCADRQGALCGPGLECACYRPIGGGTVCASGGPCSACGSDADCEAEYGIAGVRCVAAGGCCGGSSQTACVYPCALPT